MKKLAALAVAASYLMSIPGLGLYEAAAEVRLNNLDVHNAAVPNIAIPDNIQTNLALPINAVGSLPNDSIQVESAANRLLEAGQQDIKEEKMAADILTRTSRALEVGGKDRNSAVLNRTFDAVKTNGSIRDAAAAPDANESAPAESPTSKEQLAAINAAVAAVLKPFNSADTKATIQFTKLGQNKERAVEAAVTASYEKTGPDATFKLKINDLSYSYPEKAGSAPTTKLDAKIEADLLKVADQKQINELAPSADELVRDFAKSQVRRYGAAATANAKVTHKDFDKSGNLTGLGISIGLKIDLSRLPANIPAQDIAISEGSANIELTLKGLKVGMEIVSNPSFSSFSKDQAGLKEFLEGLIKNDQEPKDRLTQWIKELESAADGFTKPAQKPARAFDAVHANLLTQQDFAAAAAANESASAQETPRPSVPAQAEKKDLSWSQFFGSIGAATVGAVIGGVRAGYWGLKYGPQAYWYGYQLLSVDKDLGIKKKLGYGLLLLPAVPLVMALAPVLGAFFSLGDGFLEAKESGFKAGLQNLFKRLDSGARSLNDARDQAKAEIKRWRQKPDGHPTDISLKDLVKGIGGSLVSLAVIPVPVTLIVLVQSPRVLYYGFKSLIQSREIGVKYKLAIGLLFPLVYLLVNVLALPAAAVYALVAGFGRASEKDKGPADAFKSAIVDVKEANRQVNRAINNLKRGDLPSPGL